MFIIKVSKAWLSKPMSCPAQGGENLCNFYCCSSESLYTYYTMGEQKKYDRALDTKVSECPFKEKCTNNDPTFTNKPIVCKLYPIVLKKNLLQIHGKTFAICKGNFGTGPPAYVSFKNNIVEVFGERFYKDLELEMQKSGSEPFYLDVDDEVAKLIGVTVKKQPVIDDF